MEAAAVKSESDEDEDGSYPAGECGSSDSN